MRESGQGTGTVRRSGLRLRPVYPGGWWLDLLLLAGLAGLTLALANGHLYGIDQAVREWSDNNRPDFAYWIARVFNFLGQGGWLLTPVAAILGILTALRSRSIRPLLVVAAAYAATYLTIGPLKIWTDRAAPTSKLPPEESVKIFNSQLPAGEYSMSYPSGHVANAIIWYGAIALLLVAFLRTLGRPHPPAALARVIRIAPPLIVFCTTTYLSWHWITDSVAGILLGLFVDRLLTRIPWDDLPLPALRGGLDRPGVFTSAP
ncbi:PAP2 superfamily protein [Micromonospora pisi]|uniref:PAP2 superfamily protein n=1 Tax=Micromonospora pisi TaxID=589240 RepID=A0A495JJM1_9ACTN|nr:phosphatase PAP2 family protein [Micromonospora pisi]RKR88885.1 PAP2 superfamily protein [Micromonospora pisi]